MIPSVPSAEAYANEPGRGYALELEAVWDSTDEPVVRNSPATNNYLLDSAGKVL